MEYFFQTHNDIIENANLIREHLNGVLKLDSLKDEIDFDVIFPFLLPIVLNEQVKLSKLLGAYRAAIDKINRNEDIDINIIQYINRIEPSISIVTKEEYRLINVESRFFRPYCGIATSYVMSVRRVFYRKEIVQSFVNIPNDLKIKILNSLENISAFLLFDDDFIDIEIDIANNKRTILNEFLASGGMLKIAIDEMTKSLESAKFNKNDEFLSFDNFINGLLNVYIS